MSVSQCLCGYRPDSGGDRMMRHDAHFCKACDVWLTSVCQDTECEFCADRPPRPSLVEDRRTWDEAKPTDS
jgi:hypothetical protein